MAACRVKLSALSLLLIGCRPEASGLAETAEDPAVDSSTAEQVPGTDWEPGATLFADAFVHPLALTLDDEAWASLLAAPTTYVEATFSDGERSLQVGVRLKGFTTYQPLTGKPNLRVSFDHVVDGQRYDGLEAVDLINEAEDPASMSEAIAYRVFRAAGQPASRTGFAWLDINDQEYGLYTLVEKKDDVLIDRWWPGDDEGSLYESSSEMWPCDFDDGGTPRCDCWEQDEVGSADERADLEELCAVATDTTGEAWYPAVSAAVDWTEVSRHIATEILLDAHDHYAGYMGNVYLYHAPEADTWSLLPASMNSAFGSSRYVANSCGGSNRVPTDFRGGILAERCWADEACTADLYQALADSVAALEASDTLAQIDAWEDLLEPYVDAEPKLSYSLDEFHGQVQCIRDWLRARPEELAPYLPAGCLGKGGDLDVGGRGDLSVNGSCDRAYPDAVTYPVLDLAGARVELGSAPDGIEVGDEVILLVMQGVPGDHSEVGSYAFGEVAAADATALLLSSTPDLDAGSGTLVVQRVPHYRNVTVRSGGTLTAGAWNGETGGVLALRVSGTLLVEAGGSVSVMGIGYAGGPTGDSYNVDGYQGESLEGPGIGGAWSTDGYNEGNGAWAANLGGGGCNVGGGGGEHAGGATASSSWNGVATAPQAGETVGVADLSSLIPGSGGGGVVNLKGGSGPGGAGGGVLYLDATEVVAEGPGAIDASGEDADSWASGSWTYGAGGGAGGSLHLLAETLTLADGAVTALGGAGYADATRPGGDGGVGRIRVDCGRVNGDGCTAAALAGLTEPEAFVEE